jgi:hypothetical protein
MRRPGLEPRLFDYKVVRSTIAPQDFDTIETRYNNYITTVASRTTGDSIIFRHNKHLNFYRSVNIWKLILENFLNYKITGT